eukprot:CAMPEP_0183391992 /NCGR_PEP_ID=MMETSP0370-20130417/6821_1 /TAXON_ID=268820 /ORGANISM="Peridinium aciculiferum, Strain PAER-2" /LENGTH=471 /DNA_ID=CAMNT_0025571817 /DNA_START=92 /DNA_END=1507 /DNA_ORIENTATION=-
MNRVGVITKHVTAGSAGQTPNLECSAGELTITIIGSGNSGHVCAALIEGNTKGRVKTQLLTSNPSAWTNCCPRVTFPNGDVQVGRIHKISSDPAELIPHSDIVLWTGPVTSTMEVFETIRPYLNTRKTAVGTIFAQGLSHLLAARTFGPDVRFFALRNIPWLCRMVKKGEESVIVGAKTSIGVMTMNIEPAWVKSELEPLFVVQKTGKWEPVMDIMPDFCPVVFNPANQIIHPARYWGLFRKWTGAPLSGDDEPSEWLYRGMDEVSGQVLSVLDEELQSLKDAYYEATGAEGCREVIPLAERLKIQYGDQIEDDSTMAKMVGTNKAYSLAKTPMIRTARGVIPDPNHRVVTDDIGWGLCALVSIAERLEEDLGVKTPTTMMRMLIEWHQDLMGKEFLVNGRLCGRDCADLVLLRPGDGLELVALPPHSTSAPSAKVAGDPTGRNPSAGRQFEVGDSSFSVLPLSAAHRSRA